MGMDEEQLPEDVQHECRVAFHKFDRNNDGTITSTELADVFATLGESVPGYKLRNMIEEIDENNNGKVEYSEFIKLYCQISSRGMYSQWTNLVSRSESIQRQGGTSEASAEGTTHSSSEAEQVAFTDWINSQLKSDPDVVNYLPLSPNNLFEKLKDGIIFCKMINLSAPRTIDERAINHSIKGNKQARILMSENNALVINSASSIGCTVVNIGANDIIEMRPHLVLGLLWQVIRIGLFANITLLANPHIAVLLGDGESIEDLLKLSPEELLLRWVNYHLRKSGSNRRIQNFSNDIKDSEAYAILLSRIAPQEYGVDRPERIMSIPENQKRADLVLQNAEKINCRKFVSSRDITIGNPKLNLAFVAHLFNNYPCLDTEDIENFQYEEYEETREEKTYRNWMNSLGVNPFVYHLYNDLGNGLVLFQLFEDIKKGTVDWTRVNKPPFKVVCGGIMRKIENCNYAVELGKKNRYSLVGVGGEDIHSCKKTLVLALVWQMLRHYTVELLSKLTKKDGTQVTDAEIVEWVNEKLRKAQKSSVISNFKDQRISGSLPVIDLCDAIRPGCIDYTFVTPGITDEDKELNAQYAISMCRKIGARTYALPEDLIEVKPKMVLTVFACLMTRSLTK